MLEKEIPFSFAKFGDGEFGCMKFRAGFNCDKDIYSQSLGESLCEAIRYFSENTHSFVGAWHDETIKNWIQSLTPTPIKWVEYHSLIFDGKDDYLKAQIVKKIYKDSRKKIIVCNDLLIKSKVLFNADELVFVSKHGWFETEFDSVFEKCVSAIGDIPNPIVLTMAGLASKVLIMKLQQRYPSGTFLDFGSAVDKICTKRETRGWKISYDELISLVADILPSEWNDPKYERIYEEAKRELGIHL